MRLRRYSGFTLLEILTVLSIITIVSGITFSGFQSLRSSNRRTTCQTNLTQIYQACRLYSQDNDTYPYYNPGSANSAQPAGGLGLWALYTFPSASDPSVPAAVDGSGDPPTAMYLRNLSAFHCPNDNYDWNSDGVRSFQAYHDVVGNTRTFNPEYLSYQFTESGVSTYSLYRASGAHRQLQYFDGTAANLGGRPPSGNTVLTWCRFHRSLSANGLTTTGTNNYDNVLFADGSVQWLPAEQTVYNSDGSVSSTCSEWRRVPKAYVNNMADPTTCQPTSTD